MAKELDAATEKFAKDLTALFSGLTILDDEEIFAVDEVTVEGTHRAVVRLTMVHGAELEIVATEGHPIRIERRVPSSAD